MDPYSAAHLATLPDDTLFKIKQRIKIIQYTRDSNELSNTLAKYLDEHPFYLDVNDELKRVTTRYEHGSIEIPFECNMSSRVKFVDDPDPNEIHVWGPVDEPTDPIHKWFVQHGKSPIPYFDKKLSEIPFDYDEDYEFNNDSDWDDPARGTITIYIPLIFRRQPFPSPGKYRVIDNENIDIMTVHPNDTFEFDRSDGEIHTEDEWREFSDKLIYCPL